MADERCETTSGKFRCMHGVGHDGACEAQATEYATETRRVAMSKDGTFPFPYEATDRLSQRLNTFAEDIARHEREVQTLRAALAKAILQCGVHGAQIASLQMSQPRGITLRGWDCACGIFNSSEKEELTACRSCGLARP